MSTATILLTIGSQIGYRSVGGGVSGYLGSGGPLFGAIPFSQTTLDLNGNVFPFTAEPNNPVLYVPPLGVFNTYPGGLSNRQEIRFYNTGSGLLTITSASNFRAVIGSGLEFTHTNTFPINISPEAYTTASIRYLGLSQTGEFINPITVQSNNFSGNYIIYTTVINQSLLNFTVSPTSFITTSTVIGGTSSTSITIIPTVNTIVTDDPLEFTTSLSGSPGWSIVNGVNKVDIFWDSDYVNNSTGTYISTLTITSLAAGTKSIVNTAYVNIDYTRYKNLSTWVSAASSDNSLIGISFDIFNGIKTLTIGVGAGGDGAPIYANGGNIYAVMKNLAIGTSTNDPPNPYWSTVYSIPLITAGTYLSGELTDSELSKYITKTTEDLNYAEYFGFEQGEGSMFIVEYDGVESVYIYINNLRELSGDAGFDATMSNLTRAFHYYSGIDSPARFNQLESLNSDDPRTRLFRGFVVSTKTPSEVWQVETSIVPLPT